MGGGTATMTGNATALLDSFSFSEAGTIMRLVGGEILLSFATQTLVASDAAALTVGIGLVSTDAAAAGAASMPDPASDSVYDWIWWYTSILRNMNVTTETGLFAQGAAVSRIPINSKAMRRFKGAQSLVAVVQYADVNGAPTVFVDFAGVRVLHSGS